MAEVKNEKKEAPSCDVCTNKFTPVLRKKITCTFCNKDTCSKCIEQYLMNRYEDAHCLHCRVNYNDKILNSICTKTYLQQNYFKHRQEILMNREKANLPALQETALELRRRAQNRNIYKKFNQERQQLRSKLIEIRNQLICLHQELLVKNRKLDENENIEETARKKELIKNLEQEREQYSTQLTILTGAHEDYMYEQNKLYNERNQDIKEEKEEKEEKKKFIRKCINTGCQGFLSTSWKCGICEHFSCSKCFVVKGKDQDSGHECKKEDLEMVELIKKDSKPCPKCGEFITKSSGCSQMFCISCQTPWCWNTGKIVTNGPIHNPHYYEWLKRTGGSVPRNPADVPCGGYPLVWNLVRFPRVKKEYEYYFTEFHRICQEIQDISTRNYRTHLDNSTNSINIQYLLNEMDEKQWGKMLAVNEKKKKRDFEIQEVFGAFRMVAIELINRIQYYRDETYGTNFSAMSVVKAEEYMIEWNIQVTELINMINNAMKDISIIHRYGVPHINITNDGKRFYYSIFNINYTDIKKKKSEVETKSELSVTSETPSDSSLESDVEEYKEEPVQPEPVYHEEFDRNMIELQNALIESLHEQKKIS